MTRQPLPSVIVSFAISSCLAWAVLFSADQLAFAAEKEVRPKVASPARNAPRGGSPKRKSFSTGSNDPLIPQIDSAIRKVWDENEADSSPAADDYEWMRRVHLDVVGHIPRGAEVESFVGDKDPAKRAKLIDRLLDSPDYVRHWTTVWTNLCIGRQTPARVNREAFQKFLREAFEKNRPWNEIVVELISAEGRFDETGAVNYLLAQMTMRDEAVQATAKTARLFLGTQLQCTQCHDHPFVNEWKQRQFWELNSFFRQSRRIDHRKPNPDTGRQMDDYSELVNEDFAGPVFFERRNGEMQVAYPAFLGEKIDDGATTVRRTELARLMTHGENPLIARALVNRTWGRFFGYGFTNPVDDMGPHKAPSHPELLDLLATEFVKQGYDVKKLIRWITNSEAYNLTSQPGPRNTEDDPASGKMPLFSRMYLKPMEAEQLYDSLLIATEADKTAGDDAAAEEKQRSEWLDQFVLTFGTDENDEATTFNGTIPQALMMMNGPMIERAISAEKGSYLHTVLSDSESDVKKVQQLYLSALGRMPTRKELHTADGIVQQTGDPFAAFQDVFWAVLNSNEFIINH